MIRQTPSKCRPWVPVSLLIAPRFKSARATFCGFLPRAVAITTVSRVIASISFPVRAVGIGLISVVRAGIVSVRAAVISIRTGAIISGAICICRGCQTSDDRSRDQRRGDARPPESASPVSGLGRTRRYSRWKNQRTY